MSRRRRLRTTSIPHTNDGTRSETKSLGAYEPRLDWSSNGKAVVLMSVDLLFAVLNLAVGLACLFLALRQSDL